jgi:hypothetical protein
MMPLLIDAFFDPLSNNKIETYMLPLLKINVFFSVIKSFLSTKENKLQ